MKLSHKTLIVFSGLLWFGVGCYLLPLGLFLIYESAKNLQQTEQTGVVLVALGLAVGYLKSKYVLSKTVNRTISRIHSLPDPSSITSIFGKKYLILLAVMMALGVSIKLFGVRNDIRGTVDVAIGAALINGAVQYFRQTKKVELEDEYGHNRP